MPLPRVLASLRSLCWTPLCVGFVALACRTTESRGESPAEEPSAVAAPSSAPTAASAPRPSPDQLTPPVLGLDAQALGDGVRARVTKPAPQKLPATAMVRAEVTFWREDGSLVRTTYADGSPATFPLEMVRHAGLREALRSLGPDSVADVYLPEGGWRPTGIVSGVPLLARVERLTLAPGSAAPVVRASTPHPAPPAEHAPAHAERIPSGVAWLKKPATTPGPSAKNAPCVTLLLSAWTFTAHEPKLTASRVREEGAPSALPFGLGAVAEQLAVGDSATVWFPPGAAPTLSPNARDAVVAELELLGTTCARATP